MTEVKKHIGFEVHGENWGYLSINEKMEVALENAGHLLLHRSDYQNIARPMLAIKLYDEYEKEWNANP